jgi:hypothetical protein
VAWALIEITVAVLTEKVHMMMMANRMAKT